MIWPSGKICRASDSRAPTEGVAIRTASDVDDFGCEGTHQARCPRARPRVFSRRRSSPSLLHVGSFSAFYTRLTGTFLYRLTIGLLGIKLGLIFGNTKGIFKAYIRLIYAYFRFTMGLKAYGTCILKPRTKRVQTSLNSFKPNWRIFVHTCTYILHNNTYGTVHTVRYIRHIRYGTVPYHTVLTVR